MEMLCKNWYHLHNLINMKNTPGGVSLLVNFWAGANKFIRSNPPPWVFFKFFKLYKWY